MADLVSTPSGSTRTPDSEAADIIERRKACVRYMSANYYEEWVDVFRSAKARVKPFTRRNRKGQQIEDKTRTNVALPDHFVMVRHGVARLTRNPPNLRMRGGDTDSGMKAAAQLMYQWDRSEAQTPFRKITHCSKLLGWGVGKSYYDKIELERMFRRAIEKITRGDLMRHEGAEQDDIDKAPDADQILSGPDADAARSKYGNIINLQTLVTRYEGPRLDYVFAGDVYPDIGFKSLQTSERIIENSIRDEKWLEYWVGKTTTDPETKEEIPIIDEKKAQELLDSAGERTYTDQKELSLRRQMRDAIDIADPATAGKPLAKGRKKFLIDEEHSIDDDGNLVIKYVGDESLYLGKQWYPWNTYGRYTYNEMVLIPDLIEGIGDSTPRVARFLVKLRNTRMNQTTDFINNKLLPVLKVLDTNNFTDDDLVRTNFARVLKVQSMEEAEFMQDPPFPPEGFQDQAQLVREIQQVEPSMNDFQPGSETTPEAGKLATTAILQSKSSDAITADELNCQGHFIREVAELWLCFNQQAMEDDLKLQMGDSKRVDPIIKILAPTKDTDGGDIRSITISALDIQEDFQVLPEEGSTLADDDGYRIAKLQQGFMMASGSPDVFNKRAFGQKLLEGGAVPGMSVEEGMAPPPSPAPPPPPHVGINVAIKFETMAADAQAWLLEQVGAPTEGTVALGTVKHASEAIQHIAGAANAAADLERPADVDNGGPGGPSASTGDKQPRLPTPKGMAGGTK